MQFWTLYRIFRRWKWIIVVLSVFSALAIGVATLLVPRTYMAEALLDPPLEAGIEGGIQGATLEFVQNRDIITYLANLIRTRAVWQATMEELDEVIPFEIFYERLNVQPRSDQFIRVGWQDTQPEKAVEITNATVNAFQKYYTDLRSDEARRKREAFEQQKNEAKALLDEAAVALQQFQAENQVMDVAHVTTVRSTYDLLLTERRGFLSSLERARAQAQELRMQLSGAPDEMVAERHVLPNPSLELLQTALAQERQNLVGLLSRYNESHPSVRKSHETIASLTDQIANADEVQGTGESMYAPNPTRELLAGTLAETEADITGLMGQIEEADRQIEAMKGDLAGLPSLSLELERLVDAKQAADAAYQQIVVEAETARIDEENQRQSSYIRVVDSPSLPLTPMPRKLVLKAALGFVAIFGLCIIFALVFDQIDNRIKGPADVERLVKLRSLGAIPLLDTEDEGEGRLQEERRLGQAQVSGFHEVFRTIRGQLFLAGGDPPPRVLSIVSATASAGKTTVSVNLAESIAHTGATVLLVDADLRKPSIHSMYDVPNKAGLSSVLLGEVTLDEVVKETDVPGLYIVPGGPPPEDPPMLLGSPAFPAMVSAARETYNWIIVDTPPGITFVDAMITSVEVDAALLVIAAGNIARGAEDQLLSDLATVDVPVLGAVVNKVMPEYSDTLYHYQRNYGSYRPIPQDTEETPA